MTDNRMKELNLIERIAYKKALDDFIEKMNEQSEIARPVGWTAGIEIITMSTVRSIKEELMKEEEKWTFIEYAKTQNQHIYTKG